MIRTPMMLMLNTTDVLNHEEIRKSVQDIADNGFDAVCFEFRRSEYSEFDEIGMAAMRVAYEESKRLGLGFVKTLPTRHQTMIKRYPELKRRHFIELRSHICQGDTDISWPLANPIVPDMLIRAFRITADENDLILHAEDMTDHTHWSMKESTITVHADAFGEYLFYFAFYVVDTENRVTDCTDLDYSNDLVLGAFDELLDVYSGFDLDGYCMDEFGAGSRKQGHYLANTSFFERFEAKNGYDLRDNLYMLRHNTPDQQAHKVRFDYYDLTIDITHRYQARAKELFTAKYGKDIFIGFHHTFWGEGNSGDLWGGNIDYFRLASVLSGGFVDAQYDTERTMLSMNALAEGLAAYSDSGRAYNMCWDRITSPEKMDYYHRMLAMRNVNWVAHGIAKGLQGTPRSNDAYAKVFYGGLYITGITGNPAWGDVQKYTHREHLLDDFLNNAKSDANVAVVYIWESNAYYDSDYMHYHKLSFKALLDKLLTANIPTDVLPSFETDFSQYDVIFVPWPAMLSNDLWEALKAMAGTSKKVYFMGPPASMTTDGINIRAEFEDLVGAKVQTEGSYFGGHEYPAWDLWFTNKVIPMITYCQDGYPIESHKDNIYYFGYEAPLTETMFRIIEDLRSYRVTATSGILSKTFIKNNEHYLTLTSRWNARINDTILFDGNRIQINNGILIGIKSREGEVVQIISEEGATIYVNEKVYSYDRL